MHCKHACSALHTWTSLSTSRCRASSSDATYNTVCDSQCDVLWREQILKVLMPALLRFAPCCGQRGSLTQGKMAHGNPCHRTHGPPLHKSPPPFILHTSSAGVVRGSLWPSQCRTWACSQRLSPSSCEASRPAVRSLALLSKPIATAL